MWPRLLILASLASLAEAFVAPSTLPLTRFASQPSAASHVHMFFFGQKKEDSGPTPASNARDADLQRRQAKLAERQNKAATQPKGTVEVTFPQKGNKVVLAKQGEPLGKVISRAGLRVKFDCKNGRCGTCQVRLNGRSVTKICQGGTVPGGATRKLKITLDN